MAVLFSNNAASNLSASITSTATSLSVTAGTGAEFPNPGGSDYFYATLSDAAGNIEIIKVTARSTDTLTIVRGQDGTTARAWANSDKIELRLTAAGLGDLKADTLALVNNGLLTITAGAGLTGSGTFYANQAGNTTISLAHSDTSSQASSTNTGATVVQSLGFDTYGHVTSLATKTIGYADIGAPSTTGTNASGTWGISISGNAATATSANAVSIHASNEVNLGGSYAGGGTLYVNYADGGSYTNISFYNGGTSLAQVTASQFNGPLNGNASSASSVAWTNVSGRPTAVSSFSNDSGYITGSYLGDYTNGAYRVIADYSGSNTWYIRSNGRFTWARGHDWTQAFELNLESGTAASNNGWAEFGQRQSNNAAGTWYGTRFVQYTGSTKVDGHIRAGNHYLGADNSYITNAGDSSARVQTAYGYIDIGPKNGSWCHIYSDKTFYFNQELYVNNVQVVKNSGTWGISITGNAGYASSAGNADTLDGHDWFSYGKNIRGSDIYSDGWLRNYNSGTGLYNQATGNHFYSDGQYWNVGYGGTTGIRLRNGHNGTILGYLYAETNGNFGLLHNGGGWAVQVNPGGNGTLHGSWTTTGNHTANSDERLKDDWMPLAANFVELLAAVKSGTYLRNDMGVRHAGSSAQDWQKLLPEVVLEGTDEAKTLSLAYGNAALVSAVELAKRVVAQEARIKRLETIIENLAG